MNNNVSLCHSRKGLPLKHNKATFKTTAASCLILETTGCFGPFKDFEILFRELHTRVSRVLRAPSIYVYIILLPLQGSNKHFGSSSGILVEPPGQTTFAVYCLTLVPLTSSSKKGKFELLWIFSNTKAGTRFPLLSIMTGPDIPAKVNDTFRLLKLTHEIGTTCSGNG